MPARNDWRRLRLRDLYRVPERFSFSWPTDPEGLRKSLGEHGQRCPLLVQEGTEGLVLLDGHRRAQALGVLGVDDAWVRPAPCAGAVALWDLLLQEQRAGRELNPVEVGLYVERRRAATGESPQELAQRVCPQFGLSSRMGALDDFLWVAGLPSRHRDGFARGNLPFHAVRVLSRSSLAEATAILDLVGDAPIGVNKLSELARWVQECAWAAGDPVGGWIASAGLGQFRGQPVLLREAVRHLRFPQLTAWEASFDEDARALPLPPQARLNHPQGFEGGRLSCTLSFATLAELETAVRALEEGVRAGHWARLEKYLG